MFTCVSEELYASILRVTGVMKRKQPELHGGFLGLHFSEKLVQ
jgi:hypothetical protein